MKQYVVRNRVGALVGSRGLAVGLAASIVAPGLMAGCGGNQAQAPAQPPMGNYNAQRPVQPRMQGQGQRQGMTGKQKALLIGGAALAYYMWKKHRNAQNQALPQGVQLYQSKNGGIYYRDARDPKTPIYVVPPRAQQFNTQLQVDPSEIQGLGLDQYQGYNGGTNGTALDAVRNMLPSR